MFFLTQKAYEDLKNIATYTQDNWGKIRVIGGFCNVIFI